MVSTELLVAIRMYRSAIKGICVRLLTCTSNSRWSEDPLLLSLLPGTLTFITIFDLLLASGI